MTHWRAPRAPARDDAQAAFIIGYIAGGLICLAIGIMIGMGWR